MKLNSNLWREFDMKKKIFMVILIIGLLGITIFGMYVTDRIRMKNNKPVIFSNWGYSYVPPIDLPEEEIESAIMNYIIEKYNCISGFMVKYTLMKMQKLLLV